VSDESFGLQSSAVCASNSPKIALICHSDETLNRTVIPRWLATFSTVVGIVLIEEGKAPQVRRLRAECRRVGFWRLLDVFAFRLYYRMVLRKADSGWEKAETSRFCVLFPAFDASIPVMTTDDPNDPKVAAFLRAAGPDLVLARCKWLLSRSIYEIPPKGTFVLHPGICPQYRNAHGCFWALANGDTDNVGLTLLRIDDGIDTGPIYGYFRYRFDASTESHVRIQHRVVLENLDPIKDVLLDVLNGRAAALSTVGAASRNWGQPWLTAYAQWRLAARRAGL
jgi:hypothetical protein